MKHLLIIFSLLLLSSPLFSQETGVLFLRLENGDVGYFEKRIEDRDGKYIGVINNGKPNGRGTVSWSDGKKYVGEFKNGLPNGQGIESYSDGEDYVGEWENGKKQGLGIYTWNNGQKYAGEWKDGKMDGLGTHTFPDGRKIVGEYKKGKSWNMTGYDKYGTEKVRYVNGVRQIGKNVNKSEIFGILFIREVNGELRWVEDGDEKKDGKYVGEIENGLPNGKGRITFSSGSKYVGEWENGMQNGQGTYIYGKGRWEGDKYEGGWKDGVMNGQGTFTFHDGGKYEGEFKDDKRNGQGTYTYPDGYNSVGEWRENKPWNITEYDKNGNIQNKIVNGVEQ